eukprot:gene20633-22668_t
MNDDLYNRGSKRRLSDVDENERLTQRQTILNMSICKLQKDYGRKEPPLFRQILISNTVRRIEQEMDEESQMNCFRNDDIYPFYERSIEDESKDWSKREAKAVVCESRGPDEIRASFADIGTTISSVNMPQSTPTKDANLVFVADDNLHKKTNKFGAIGDHRKQQAQDHKTIKEKTSIKIDMKIWEDSTSQLHLPMITVPTTGNAEGDVEFSFQDIDIALYDFDFLSYVPHQHDWKPFTEPLHLPLTSLSCGAEAEKKKGDSFFDDLDQIMQVLVGM